MSHFIWGDGHLGWGIFTLLVFTASWWLAADLFWRMKNLRFTRFASAALAAWCMGAALIAVVFWLVDP